MTIEELFSKEVGDYVVELNKKYQNISADEFRDLLDEFVDNHKVNIIEEEIDFGLIDDDSDEDSDEDLDKELKKKLENDSEEELDKEPDEELDKEPDEELDKEPDEDKKEDKRKTTIVKTHDLGSRKSVKTVFRRPDLDPDDDRYVLRKDSKGRVRRRPLVDNSKDSKRNIHKIVETWYNRCIKEKNGENEMVVTRLKYLYTSEVKDMSALFAFCNVPRIDLSEWDTSNVENMEGMFYRSTFNNSSIENWDVSSCKNFKNMFVGSRFSGDISKWVPGSREEFVYDDEGYVIKEVDPKTGEERLKTKRVLATLPKVGARLTELEVEGDEERMDLLDYDYTDEDDEGGVKENKSTNKHILTIDEFVNEGLYDKIKHGFKRGLDIVKKSIRTLKVKLNDFFVVNINPFTGTIINAIDIDTTLNYVRDENPKGVSLCMNGFNNVDLSDTSRYGWIKKGSVEARNYVTFMNMLFDSDSSSVISEAKIPLISKGSGLELPNITTSGLIRKIRDVMINTPSETGRSTARTLVVYGAPGIGKTSIPKSIIKEYNREVSAYNETEEGKKNPKGKKAIIVIECGDLELGGFNIPMPQMTNLKDVVFSNTAVKNSLIRGGYTDSDFAECEKISHMRTFESPKTWLPVYYTGGTKEERVAAQAVANGRHIESMVYNKKTKKFDEIIEETTEGGIIIFDEFLRADPELFKTICQLVQNRTIGHGEYRLGSMWGIICCSNRPCDDDEVKAHYDQQSVAMSNRFLDGAYNFVPDFYEWLDWAKKDGHFDDYTLSFIAQDTPGNKEEYTVGEKGGEKDITIYANWHNADVEKFSSGAEPIPTTPRGWAAIMEWVEDRKRVDGVSSIFDIDMNDLRLQACGVIGREIGNAYVDYMEDQKKLVYSGKKPPTSKFFESEIPGDEIDVNAYKVSEAIKDIEQYVRNNFTRSDIESADTSIGESFLIMAMNLDKFYAKSVMPTDIKMLHNNIVRNIFKIRKDKKDKNIIINMRPYLEYIGDPKRYDVNLLDS